MFKRKGQESCRDERGEHDADARVGREGQESCQNERGEDDADTSVRERKRKYRGGTKQVSTTTARSCPSSTR